MTTATLTNMTTPIKVTEEHLKKLHSDPHFVTLSGHLLMCAMHWILERQKSSTPFTAVETELMTVAIATVDEVSRVAGAS